MIPSLGTLNTELKEVEIPTNTHRIVYAKARVNGNVDDLEAIRQAVYLILSTERYKFPIYSWNYGVELVDLIGQNTSLVIPELKKRITEALLADSRISEVSDFQFTVNKNKVTVKFIVSTAFGELDSGIEVNI